MEYPFLCMSYTHSLIFGAYPARRNLRNVSRVGVPFKRLSSVPAQK